MKRCWVILILSACGTDGRSTRDSSVDTSPDIRDDAATIEPSRPSPQYLEPRRSILSNEQVGRLAIPFQENDGQWDSEVAFKADHFAGSLWVTTNGSIVYSLLGPQVEETSRSPNSFQLGSSSAVPNAVTDPFGLNRAPSSLVEVIEPLSTSFDVPLERGVHDPFERNHEQPSRGPGWTLVEHFVHGHPHRPRGLDPAVTNVSYFIGNDESNWAPHVSTFGALTLGEVWPGIEVRLVARGNNVEKFFHVSPHRDPSLIEMSIEGADSLRLSEDGSLLVRTGHGEVQLSPPVAYQDIDGERREVNVRYELLRDDSYRFILGDYDRSYEVVVDPILQSTYLGGTGADFSFGGGIALNGFGDVLLFGDTTSTDYPGSTGGAQVASMGGVGFFGPYDFVVSRLNGSLTSLLQTTYLGGTDAERSGGGLIVAGNGEVLVTGSSFSADYPGTSGGAQAIYGGGGDTVVSRLNGSLTSLLQSTYLGGSAADWGPSNGTGGIAIDSSDNVIIEITSSSDNYPGTMGAAQAIRAGSRDIAISRFNAGLTALLQSTYLGGSGSDEGLGGVAIDGAGNVLILGTSNSTNFPGTSGAARPFNGGGVDLEVSRLNGSLTGLFRSTYLGGSGSDFCGNRSIAINAGSGGSVVVLGSSASTDYPGVTGGAQPTLLSTQNGVVSRLNGTLTVLEQSTYLGGVLNIDPSGVLIDGDGDVLVLGSADSAGLPGTAGAAQDSFGGDSNDAFVARLSNDLTTLRQSTYLGGAGVDDGRGGMALSGNSELLVLADTFSSDYPGTVGGAQAIRAGSWDSAITRLTADLLGCSSNSECLRRAGGGLIFSGRPMCNLLTRQCFACTSDAECEDDNLCTANTCAAGLCVTTDAAAGSECRSISGPCDTAETCPGGGAACPVDAYLGASNECRAVSAECDAPEFCDGNSAACPLDAFDPLGSPCASGVCQGSNDVCVQCLSDDNCSGATPLCDVTVNECADCTNPNVSCPAGTECDGTTRTCRPDTECASDNECGSPTPVCNLRTRTCIGCGDGSITCSSNELCDPESGRCGLDPNGDADGDGIRNGIECTLLIDCIDTDGDNTPDYLDPDDDGDSVPTSAECSDAAACDNTDGDALPNYIDPDDDGDGISTVDEVTDGRLFGTDVDLDGLPNYLDTASDGDDSPDQIEGRNLAPSGTPAYLDTDFLGGGGIAGGALRCTLEPSAKDSPFWVLLFTAIGLAFVRRRQQM